MGKSILTSTQHHFLELATKEKEITDWFLLVGGTALSEFYLHHRLSEDLDFFSTSEVNDKLIERIISKYIKRFAGSHFTKRKYMGLYIYQIYHKNGEVLKIDFNHFVFEQLEPGKNFKTLKIASLWDITIDKFYTLLSNPRSRDYVDFYLAIKEQDCDMHQLRHALNEKYEFTVDEPFITSQLLRVKDVSDFPKMLVPFDRNEMEKFYLHLAKSLEPEIFA